MIFLITVKPAFVFFLIYQNYYTIGDYRLFYLTVQVYVHLLRVYLYFLNLSNVCSVIRDFLPFRIQRAHRRNFFFHLFDKLVWRGYFYPAALAEEPHFYAVAVDFGFERVFAAAAFDYFRGRQFVEDCLHGGAGEFEAYGPELSGPHEEAAFAEEAFVEFRRFFFVPRPAVFHDAFYAVCSEV